MNFIRDLLNENNIILKAKAFNKEEAVRLAAEPLLKDGSITEEYVKDILEKINDLGPYMAIMPEWLLLILDQVIMFLKIVLACLL